MREFEEGFVVVRGAWGDDERACGAPSRGSSLG